MVDPSVRFRLLHYTDLSYRFYVYYIVESGRWSGSTSVALWRLVSFLSHPPEATMLCGVIPTVLDEAQRVARPRDRGW